MIVLHEDAKTAIAIVTMVEVFTPANPTDSALITVENLLRLALVIVEGANRAEILRKIFVALDARLRFRLGSLAAETLHMRNFVSFESMIFLRIHLVLEVNLIVAESADVEFSRTDRIGAL